MNLAQHPRQWLHLAAAGFAAVLLAACVAPVAAQAPADAALPAAQQRVFRRALERVAPLIVRIETIGGSLPVAKSGDPEEEGPIAPRFRQAEGPTTGTILSADGYIISSNFNFMRSPTVITVRLHDGRRLVARLVARDSVARLALLKVDADDLPQPEWADAETLRPGQWLLTAGYGHGGAAPLVSVGILSGRARISGLALQTDAKTSPVNYGGPLFDIDGRIAGICVPMSPSAEEIAGLEWYDSGIGFAVTPDVLRSRLERLRAGENLERGLLGVSVDGREVVVGQAPSTQPSPPADGLRIIAPPRGPAAAAGLAEGDVITHVAGSATLRLIDLRRTLARYSAGDEVAVRYRRGDEALSAKLVLVTQSALAPAASRPASQPASGPTSRPD